MDSSSNDHQNLSFADTMDHGDPVDFFSRSPPNFTPSSYEVRTKRCRSGSISSRVRSASNAEDLGLIDRAQRDALKDLIILGADPALSSALDKFAGGEVGDLESLIKSGVLDDHPQLDELVDNLDHAFHNMPGVDEEVSARHNMPREGSFDFNDIYFEGSFLDDGSNCLLHEEFLGGRMRAVSIPEESEVEIESGDQQQEKAHLQHQPIGNDNDGLLSGIGLEGGALSWGSVGTLDLEDDLNDFGGRPAGSNPTPAAGTKTRGSSRSSTTQKEVTVVQGANGVSKAFEGKVTFPAKLLMKAETGAGCHLLNQSGRTKSASIEIPKSKELTAGNRYNLPQKMMPITGSGNAAMSMMPSVKQEVDGGGSGGGVGEGAVPGFRDTVVKVESRLEGSAEGENTSLSAPMAIKSNPTMIEEEGKHMIGAYSPESRKARIERFLEKKKKRIWHRKVKYNVRKNFADSRIRVKGRFVKKEDEAILFEMSGLGEAAPGAGEGVVQHPPPPPPPSGGAEDDDLLGLEALFPDPDDDDEPYAPPPVASHLMTVVGVPLMSAGAT